jgi:hypothetical protein
MSGVNLPGIWAIYRTEMARTRRTVWQSVATPVITTVLYFIVFGGAIGSRMQQVGGVGYGAFIVPGLIMLTLLTQGISNASIAIYFPKFTRTIYELLSAPISSTEAVCAYVAAAATKSVAIGLIILATATLFVPVRIMHPGWMAAFLVLTAVSFSLFGFVIGIWAESFEQLAIIPSLIVTHAAPALADGKPVQPGGLSRQRLPLEFLRRGRCQSYGQPRLRDGVHGAVPSVSMVDIPHGVSSKTVAKIFFCFPIKKQRYFYSAPARACPDNSTISLQARR